MGSLHSPSSASEVLDSTNTIESNTDNRQKRIEECANIVKGMLDKCLGVQIEGLGNCRTVDGFIKLMSPLSDDDVQRIEGMLTGQRLSA